MLFFLLIMAGDFTFKPNPGYWIDYARTGYLSENRFLVVQHKGEKGEYKQGSIQMVLDENGGILYEIPEAENAWVVRNGILGDQDTFLFQNRMDPAFYLWRPEYGAKALALKEFRPGQSPGFHRFLFNKAKSRVIFISYVYVKGKPPSTLVEIGNFTADTPQALFEDLENSLTFLNTQLNMFMEYSFNDESLLFYHFARRVKEYYQLDLDAPLDKGNPIQVKQAANSISSMDHYSGFLSYSSYLNGESVRILEKQDTATPLLVLNYDSQKESPAFEPIRSFFDAFGNHMVHYKDGCFSYYRDDQFVKLDLNDGTLKRFTVVGSQNKGWLYPKAKSEIFCDDKVFRVKERKPDAPERLEPNLDLKIPQEMRSFE